MQTKTNDKTVWHDVPGVFGVIYTIYELDTIPEKEVEFRVQIATGGYFWATKRVPRDVPREIFLGETARYLINHRDMWAKRQPK